MDQTFMKEKPVVKLVISMALPMVVSMLVNSLYNIVDSYFVAKISEDAMTALSLVFPLQNLVNAIAIGFGVGINVVIAYFLGAKEQTNANNAAAHGFLYSLLHGIVLTVFCVLFIPVFLKLFTSDTDVIRMGLQYSYIVFAFSIILCIELYYEKVFQAVGRMTISMISLLLGCITNIILDPLLIFGIGFFPRMGIQGAALATCIGQAACLVVYLIIARIRPLPLKISFRGFHFSSNMTRRLYTIGIPASLNLLLPSLMITALNAILATFSQTYILVLGVYYKLQTFLYLPANGIIQGIRPLVGYNYGAKEMKRVKSIYSVSLLFVLAIMALGTILCMALPAQLIGLFTTQAETIQIGVTALRIIGIGFIASSVSVVSCGALEGLGKGTPSLWISLFRYFLILVPVAFLLTRIMGANGIWHGFWVAEISTAVIAWFLYKRSVSK